MTGRDLVGLFRAALDSSTTGRISGSRVIWCFICDLGRVTTNRSLILT